MFDHVVFGASDYEASKAFFVAALEPLGVGVVSEGPLGIELCRPNEDSSLCIRLQPEPKPAIFTWPSKLRAASKSKPSIAQLSQPVPRTMALQAYVRSTTPTTT